MSVSEEVEDITPMTPIAYDRNTSITMRLQVNYLVIAPPTLRCSTAGIDQTSVTSWTIQTIEY